MRLLRYNLGWGNIKAVEQLSTWVLQAHSRAFATASLVDVDTNSD